MYRGTSTVKQERRRPRAPLALASLSPFRYLIFRDVVVVTGPPPYTTTHAAPAAEHSACRPAGRRGEEHWDFIYIYIYTSRSASSPSQALRRRVPWAKSGTLTGLLLGSPSVIARNQCTITSLSLSLSGLLLHSVQRHCPIGWQASYDGHRVSPLAPQSMLCTTTTQSLSLSLSLSGLLLHSVQRHCPIGW